MGIHPRAILLGGTSRRRQELRGLLPEVPREVNTSTPGSRPASTFTAIFTVGHCRHRHFRTPADLRYRSSLHRRPHRPVYEVHRGNSSDHARCRVRRQGVRRQRRLRARLPPRTPVRQRHKLYVRASSARHRSTWHQTSLHNRLSSANRRTGRTIHEHAAADAEQILRRKPTRLGHFSSTTHLRLQQPSPRHDWSCTLQSTLRSLTIRTRRAPSDCSSGEHKHRRLRIPTGGCSRNFVRHRHGCHQALTTAPDRAT